MRSIVLLFVLLVSCAPVRKNLRNNISLDVGSDLQFGDAFPYGGISYSFWKCSISVGVWTTLDGQRGPYQGVGCAFTPFADDE